MRVFLITGLSLILLIVFSLLLNPGWALVILGMSVFILGLMFIKESKYQLITEWINATHYIIYCHKHKSTQKRMRLNAVVACMLVAVLLFVNSYFQFKSQSEITLNSQISIVLMVLAFIQLSTHFIANYLRGKRLDYEIYFVETLSASVVISVIAVAVTSNVV